MKIAFGIRAHSGWAAQVAIGGGAGSFSVVDRRRIELAREEWGRQPYHAAEKLEPDAARDLVERGIQAVRLMAAREIRASILRETRRDNEVVGCAVLVGEPMPAWTVEQILAVHFRMHKAEGSLFTEALAGAVQSCGISLFRVSRRDLERRAEDALGIGADSLAEQIAALGKRAGPPWGKDQKEAALAAMVGLVESSKQETTG